MGRAIYSLYIWQKEKHLMYTTVSVSCYLQSSGIYILLFLPKIEKQNQINTTYKNLQRERLLNVLYHKFVIMTAFTNKL